MKKFIAIVMITASLFTLTPFASALDIGDIARKVAIGAVGGYAVSKLGPQLNDFINTLTLQNGVKYQGYTKVVPIVSIGTSTRIGAAQVGAQSKAALEQTKAVAQIDGEFNSITARALIPINNTNPVNGKGFKRVAGVGVTAIIDVKL